MLLRDHLRWGSTSNVPHSPTVRRFPKPKPTSSPTLTSLKSGVSDHITLATSHSLRPPSPLKVSTTLSDAENDIIPSFRRHEPTLSKVYGSVLQPKDTLTLHSCAICGLVFPPDATIYPNLSASQSEVKSFLCRPCFTANGGSKGTCPSCSRPVLALKTEGGFIQSGDSYWHKRCYNCAGCFRNIGDAPMVDLFGRPSCVECFDNCLKRDHPATPKKNRTSNNNSPNVSNPGGLNVSYGPGRKSRENSPALEELEQRLGLVKSRENSPAVIDPGRSPSGRKLNSLNNSHSDSSPNRRSTYVDSPRFRGLDVFDDPPSNRPHNSQNLFVDKLSSKSLRQNEQTTAPDTSKSATASPTREPISHGSAHHVNNPLSAGQLKAYQPDVIGKIDSETRKPMGREISNRMPNVDGDVSLFSLSTSSTNSSPAMTSSSKSNNSLNSSGMTSMHPPAPVTTSAPCGKCGKAILNSREAGQFVTIPGADENAVPQIYHTECFKCALCDKAFNDPKKGSVSFVKYDGRPCHVQCAPSETFVIQKSNDIKSMPDWAPTIPHDLPTWTSSKPNNSMPPPPSQPNSFQMPLAPLRSPSKPAFPRFGGQTTCPGCRKSVSLMERGVVPGPQGSRWHASCLVCGGKKETTRATLLGRVREDKKKGEPGCGKKLDSAAKSDGEGGVWCRECLLLLGVGGSPQASPTRSPLVPSFTGSQGKINPQFTGTTTLARQFTGLGGNDAVLRQLTGGGLSPTRSISPTKQLGMMGTGNGGMRPRPKSVIGMRNTKSVDEGRGMYLVRQLTGATSSGGWGET
ncbi:hypothetical protein BDZ97DRAFT_1912347 [Flammula alnicola]|nr:hypothetical protein BDZ97DRAFT_1912347 [Flammula alnicola]